MSLHAPPWKTEKEGNKLNWLIIKLRFSENQEFRKTLQKPYCLFGKSIFNHLDLIDQ
jgi:hypothetical protein